MNSIMRLFCLALSLVACCSIPGSSDARTWRVTADGAGDAPSIEAAMDSAAAFDTVLVAPGEHVIERVFVTDGVSLIGEEDPLRTRLVPYPNPIGGVKSRLVCSLLSRPTQISGFWFDGFGDEGAISATSCVDIRVLECVFTNNEIGVVVDTDVGRINFVNNTFADNFRAIDVYSGATTCRHNIIWDPAYGLEGTVVCNDVLRLEDVPLVWRPGNFSLDPQFCGPGDYHIAASSPCAPGNSPRGDNCDLIGALPVGCNPTVTEESTWGRVKALYRKP
jgi:hypothetical protein